MTLIAMTDQLEVTLNVPDLGPAVRFYRTLLDSPPAAAERRVAWFDVPGSELRLAVRETATPSATGLRVCIDPDRLRAASRRLHRPEHGSSRAASRPTGIRGRSP